MLNCAIYIRKSREEKDKPSHRLTVQREQLPAYAASQGWSYTIYDDGHASAAQGKTEGLKERSRLETDIRAGKTNIILCIELSRLSRDDTMQDYVSWLALCAQHRVRLATLSRCLDPSHHSDWMLLLMEGGFSSVEMKVLQARMKEGRDQAFQSGKFLGGGCPAPYRYDKAQGRPIIDPDLLAKAHQIWKLAETMSARAAANQMGIPHIATRRMLSDDRLLYYQALRIDPATGNTIPCDWEPCITTEQAERIRASRRKGWSGPKRIAGGLLSNLSIMYCGYCHAPYRGFKGQTRKDGSWTDYYGCRGKETKGQCPRTSMIEQSIIDDRVVTNMLGTLEKIPALKSAWSASKKSGEGPDRLEQVAREITSYETKKQRITAAIADGVMEFADAKQQMATIKSALTRLQNERSELLRAQCNEPEWEILAEIGRIYHHIDREEQREIIQQIIKQIRVYPTYLIIEYNFPRSNDGASTARVHLPIKAV
jgi:DNA invertase Pin-like site-specific DNA recombinase